MDTVLEAPRGLVIEELLHEIQAMSPRSVNTYTESELAGNHPLRHWKLNQ
jgi:hypothetical protein